MRLLLVEDNTELAECVNKAFHSAGYDVDAVTTAAEARSALFATSYAILILDLGLPDEDGLSLLKELRKRDRFMPILILSARSGITDRVSGLSAGAEDYLVKPFALEELIARVQVLLRRVPPQQSVKMANMELIMDNHGSQVLIEGQSQSFRARDIAVLEILLRRPGRVVSKKTLASHLSTGISEVTSDAIDVYVHRLRKALESSGAKVSITTVKGVGYIIREMQ